VWKKSEVLVKTTLREDRREKRPLGRPRLRWEDCVKRDVADFQQDTDWHTLAENRDGLRQLCLDVGPKGRKQKK